LLKRFESSVTAFEATCERLLLKLWAFVAANAPTPAEQRRLNRWQGQHEALLARVKLHQAASTEEDDDDTVPIEFLEAATELSRSEYRVDEIVDETYLDLDELVLFLNDLTGFTAAHDDKLQTLLKLLKTDPLLQRHKVLIFSEYKETAEYVFAALQDAQLGPCDVVHSGSGRDRGDLITAFAPYYNDSNSAELKANGQTETRILVSTDVLAEGLNLQDATLLINYDLHWNPVRLMQRIGRVDRRLDPAVEARLTADHPEVAALRGTVHFWNFLPPDELNDLLSLYQTVAHKTLRISKVFGIEGKQLLKPDDDYAALKDFNHALDGPPSSVEQLRLAYQKLLQQHPELEAQLAQLPSRVFSGRAHPTAGVKAVFCCYALPMKNSRGEWGEGDAQWYLYDCFSEKILAEAETIDAVIRSEVETPRHTVMSADELTAIRKQVEAHIKNSYLKAAQAPVGVKPILKAWLELN
jgi:hypothetical protein